jgi:hypothetical protein
MAADNDIRLLSKAIRDRDIRPILVRGIDDTYFTSPEAKQVWAFTKAHWAKYDEVPTSVTVKNNYPNFRLLNVTDTIEYLADETVAFHQRMETVRMVQDAADALVADPSSGPALAVLTAGLGKIQAVGSTVSDLDMIADPLSRLTAYQAFQALPNGLLGLPTGFPTIDKATSGLQPEQLVTIIAAPKVGKSTLAMQMAINAHNVGATALFQSFEMSNAEQQQRYDAMRAKISHSSLRTGTLSLMEERLYEAMLTATAAMPNPFILTDAVSGLSVSAITAKAEQLRPSMLVIDGVYLMTDEVTGECNTPQALTNITRSLKKSAQKLKIPIIITTQVLLWKMKKGQVSADAIGYCVDEETEILTQRGWKTYDTLQVGDLTLTLNHDSGLSEWQPVQAVNVFPEMTRTMALMEGKAHSSLTTMQHRWPVLHHYSRRGTVDREWRTTGDLNAVDYLITAAETTCPTMPTYTDSYVDLMAWFWTEGHINGRHGNVGITQSHTVNLDHTTSIRDLLEKEFGSEWFGPIPRMGRCSDGAPRWRANVRDKGITEFWLSVDAGRALLANAPDKVPTWDFLRKLTKDQLHSFIRVSMLADNNGPNALSQKRRDAAEMFQFACTLAGINTGLQQDPSGMWRVGMRKRQVVTPIASAAQDRRFVARAVTHTGIIWCPTTQNSTWFARRKGNVYFTGNSSSFFQDSDVILGLQADEDNPMERILKVVSSRNTGPAETALKWDWTTGEFEELGAMIP